MSVNYSDALISSKKKKKDFKRSSLKVMERLSPPSH